MMGKTTSTTRATARIKQLCCLGLPSEAVIPSVLTELHAVIPSCGNSFFWADEHYQLVNIYDESPSTPDTTELYVQEFQNRPERELNPGFTYSMRHLRGVIEFDRLMTVDRRTYSRSDMYNLVVRPKGYERFLHLNVHASSRPLGTLTVWHGPGEAEFTAQDKRRLANLGYFIAHAVSSSARDELNIPLVENETRGLMIVDRHGKIQYLSPQAGKLLFLATHTQVTKQTTQSAAARLPPEVMRLCRNLVAVFEGKQEAAARPMHQHRNPWGGFTFRAYWLDNGNPLASLIGITIEHQVPLAIKLIRQTECLPALSRRQVQLCLYMASGLSYKQMAQRMDVRESTAIYHSRELYTKLDVHNRTELVNKLMAM